MTEEEFYAFALLTIGPPVPRYGTTGTARIRQWAKLVNEYATPTSPVSFLQYEAWFNKRKYNE